MQLVQEYNSNTEKRNFKATENGRTDSSENENTFADLPLVKQYLKHVGKGKRHPTDFTLADLPYTFVQYKDTTGGTDNLNSKEFLCWALSVTDWNKPQLLKANEERIPLRTDKLLYIISRDKNTDLIHLTSLGALSNLKPNSYNYAQGKWKEQPMYPTRDLVEQGIYLRNIIIESLDMLYVRAFT